MNKDDKFRSAFRTVELMMIAMLASGATNNFVFWITFAWRSFLMSALMSLQDSKKL